MVFSKVRISRLFQGLGFVGFFKVSDLLAFSKVQIFRFFSRIGSLGLFKSFGFVGFLDGSFSWLAKQTG